MTDLSGKTALVTGSTSGIGKATATALAARGAHVLVVGRNEQRAKDVVAEIEGSGGSAIVPAHFVERSEVRTGPGRVGH